jgi:flagellar protein FlaG
MTIDSSIPAIAHAVNDSRDSIQIQAANREVIQAVRAVNASGTLGDRNQLTFTLDRRTRRPVITIVNRATNEIVQQIPNEQVLRLAENLKQPDSNR